MQICKKSMVMLLLLLAVMAGGTLYGYFTSEDALDLDAHERNISANEIVVYVSGEVAKPGLVSLQEGSRAAEAINQCGGLLPTADNNSINMAQILADGMQIKVLAKNIIANQNNANSISNKAVSQVTSVQIAQTNGLININQADIDGLKTLPGIGEVMAQRIIDFRNENGSFSSIEDLQKVKGIGKAKFD